jgi:hypothetical protein
VDIASTGVQRVGSKKAINPKARASDTANDSADEDTSEEHSLSPPPPGTGQFVDKMA